VTAAVQFQRKINVWLTEARL